MKNTAIAGMVLLVAATVAAAPAKPKAPPKPPAGVLAPQTLAHPDAMFLASLCNQGARRITFKAAALSTRFFLEEPAGVTVYLYDGSTYRREKFIKGATLEKTMKSYAKH